MAFPDKTPDEVRLLTFDFSAKAATGVTLSSPTAAVYSVLSGTGVTSDLTLGTAAVADLTVTALGTGGADGTRYRLKATAAASNGETLEVFKDIAVSIRSGVIA